MKYTAEQVQSMAKTALEAKRRGDPRYLALVLGVSVRANCDPAYVEQMIIDYSNGEGI